MDSKWMKYAGMAGQFFASITLGLFLGYKIDQWAALKSPWFIWILPLLIILGLLIHLIRETNQKP